MTTFDFLIALLLIIACFACACGAGQIMGELFHQTQPPAICQRMRRTALCLAAMSIIYGSTAAVVLARILWP